jgi:hypothetical protein
MPANFATPAIDRSITDVAGFFQETTEGYLRFERHLLQTTAQLPHRSAEDIRDECDLLRRQQQELAVRDAQLISLLDLGGEAIALHQMVQDYRLAFARASMACNNLHQSLLALRQSLQAAVPPAQPEELV